MRMVQDILGGKIKRKLDLKGEMETLFDELCNITAIMTTNGKNK